MDKDVFLRDPRRAFDEAIRNGDLTEAEACDLMYMYSRAGSDFFKHVHTRAYREVAIRDG